MRRIDFAAALSGIFTNSSSSRIEAYYPVSLNKDQVEHIAMLARLTLAADETDDVVDKLSRIVDFVDQLQTVPTDDVVPMAHPLNQSQRLRADRVTEVNERERIQENAPAVADGLYLVPKVIE